MEQNYYDKNSRSFFDETVNIDLSGLYDTFSAYLDKGARILDAGCGSGRDSKIFINKGYKVVSFDSSAELTKLASNYIGKQVKLMDFSQLGETDTYDGVWCCASLLHIPQDQLLSPILLFKNVLKSKGIMYFSFKYGKEEYIKNNRYFTDMNENRMEKLIDKIPDLEIVKTWVTPDKRPGNLGKWFNVILCKN
jgi:2-polyprenyl-3-methyl-5-hydroxy-6-metoxy-1,4-benzoquinol methylase